MMKTTFLTIFFILSNMLPPVIAGEKLHLEMFPPVKIYDINDPADFDKRWNGESMICLVKGEINPDLNQEGMPMGTYEWKCSIPVAGEQPPKGKSALPIYPDVLIITPFPLPAGQPWLMISFELIVSYVEGDLAKTDGDSISFSILDKKK